MSNRVTFDVEGTDESWTLEDVPVPLPDTDVKINDTDYHVLGVVLSYWTDNGHVMANVRLRKRGESEMRILV